MKQSTKATIRGFIVVGILAIAIIALSHHYSSEGNGASIFNIPTQNPLSN